MGTVICRRYVPPVMRSKGQMGALAKLVKQDSKLQKFLKDFQELVGF